jgi:hypothetical protein
MKTSNRLRTITLALALGLGLATAAQAQVIGYSPRTGDIWVDTQLGQMNDYYGRYDGGYRDYYVDDMVGTYGVPRYLVNDLLTQRNWSPGDVYYASALAYASRRPLADVVRAYDDNRGQGWGVVAQRMGIKPGSAQFHALKGHMGKSNGKYKGYASRNTVNLNDGGPGNSGKGNGKKAAGPAYDDGSPGNSGKAKGNSGKGKPDTAGKGKGNGKGNKH